MSLRHRARRLALQGLCCLDVQGERALEGVRQFIDDSREPQATLSAAHQFLADALTRRAECDQLLARHAKHWDLSRLALVDRNILRLAASELRGGTTPPKVVITEAIHLAREFSTAESSRFVNGVLDAVMRELEGKVPTADETDLSSDDTSAPLNPNSEIRPSTSSGRPEPAEGRNPKYPMALFKGAIQKLAAGLVRTREKFVSSLRTLLVGRQLDEALLEELEARLIQADLGVATVRKICDDLQAAYKEKRITRSEEVLPFLKEGLKKCWGPSDLSVHFAPQGPTVILVAGINGSGKTTSVAKLAWYFQQQGKKVYLAAADTFRAAAVEQLTIWAQRIGVDLVKGSGSDPGAVVFDACDAALARKADVLLVDTAGRLHTQDHLMRELTKVRDVVARKIPGAPHEVLLVLDATTGQNATSQARAFTAAIDVTGIFLAKLDGTAKGGIVVAIRNEIHLPVKFVGIGETVEDVEPFDPDQFVEALFS